MSTSENFASEDTSQVPCARRSKVWEYYEEDLEIMEETEIMEGLPVVCYYTGTMNSLLDKLKTRSNSADEFSVLAVNLQNDLWSLKEKFVDQLSGRRMNNKQLKVCLKQVRELAFNIEDWIDQRPETNLGDISFDPFGRQKFEYFKSKIESMIVRLQWYFELFEILPSDTDTSARPQVAIDHGLLMEEKSCHGVLDGPRHKLVMHLIDEGGHMRKVISVVGREGLGKTTLAKEIYSELQPMFECQAFIFVGRRRAMREILGDLLRQVMPWSPKLYNWQSVDVQDIITELWEYLGTKRYFIIVDGIWSTWAWETINCVLPNNVGSKVLTTTCMMDVARFCSRYPDDLVYEMEALNMHNSRIFFLSKTISLPEEEKWAGFEEDSRCLLKMCDGMPGAIVVAAGLFVAMKSKSPAEQKTLRESIYSSVNHYSVSDAMNKILQLSFDDLTPRARLCFLYLGGFREYGVIKKDHLIRLWGAERFIDKEFLWVTGESYFSELITRRLIQPVFGYEDDQAVGCTVHTVVLDFIRSMSREENFATRATELSSGPFPCDTIRRFSVDCGNEDEAGTLCTSSVHLSSMRSLTVFGDVEGKHDPLPRRISMIDLSAFKLLRVLDLEDTKNLATYHLEGIGGLVFLRYLGLAGTGMNQLPEAVAELRQLETLDLSRNGRVMHFPTSIGRLQKVSQLLLDEMDARDIWEMQELEAISVICVDTSSSLGKVIELLRRSERLRMLGLTLGTSAGSALGTSVPWEADIVSFLTEVVNSELQSLSLYFRLGYEAIPLLVDSWEKVIALLAKKFEPRRFELEISYYKLITLPPNMGSLASLTHLHIRLHEAKAEDFRVLEGLTNLVLLNMSADCYLVTVRIIIKAGIFSRVKVFSFQIRYSWMGLEFEEGAMPQIQRLGRGFQVSGQMQPAYPDIGMEHLTCLTRVHATINCEGATVSQVEAVETAIRRQMSQITTKPTLELSRSYETMMRKNELEQHSSKKRMRV